MFKKFFERDKKDSPSRSLDHPRDLQKGDAIIIGFDEHPEISNAELLVENVTGLDLSAKFGFERRIFHLGQTKDNRPLLLWVHNEGNGEQLAFAYGANQPHVEDMIHVDQFAELFTSDRDYLVDVKSHKQARKDNAWLANSYTQDQSREVYWLDKDPRDLESTNSMSDDEQSCDYFRLTSKDRKAAIEVFVFDGGRTDVYFVKYLPLYKIEEMSPGG
jgi:hypothetical protein